MALHPAENNTLKISLTSYLRQHKEFEITFIAAGASGNLAKHLCTCLFTCAASFSCVVVCDKLQIAALGHIHTRNMINRPPPSEQLQNDFNVYRIILLSPLQFHGSPLHISRRITVRGQIICCRWPHSAKRMYYYCFMPSCVC